VLMNGWEIWEPKDKSKKDAVRTYWSLEEEEISSEKNVLQEKIGGSRKKDTIQIVK